MSSQINLVQSRFREKVAPAAILPLILFCLTHFIVDVYSIGLAVLQPLLMDRLSLTLTDAGLLGGVLAFSSSVMQPVYGYLSDRFHTRMFTVLAPAVAGIFISSMGLATGLGWLLVMAWMGGAGIASFHPQASANATAGIGTHRGRAMAIFLSAGTLGLAFGPTYFSLVTSRVGLSGTLWAATPGVLMTLLLLFFLRFTPPDAHTRRGFDFSPLRAVWKQITLLFILVLIRSVVQITFAQFLPLYLTRERGYALDGASYVTSAFLLFGATGGFVGGHLADRFGGKRVILISMIGSVPFLLLFVHGTGAWSVAGLVLGGLILLFTIPVNVMMGQDLVPTQAGTVSALMMGFGWGMAGIVFIPLTGWVSEQLSMQYAFAGLVLTPLIGFLVALKLKET
jgi:MFS transporter, FSR family, fosmidomycin resistance protein